MQLHAMKAKRKEVMDRMESIVGDGTRKLQTYESVAVNDLLAESKNLDEQIEAIESRNTIRNLPMEAFLGGAGGGVVDRPHLPSGGKNNLREAMQFATPEQREEVQQFARYLGGDMTALADLTPSGDGSVIIPTVIAGVIERNYAQFAPVLSVCRIWPTDTGEPTRFPVISDTESATILAPAALTGFDATISGDTPVTALTGPLMGAYKFSSKPVFIPWETITDSMLNVVDEILGALMARNTRLQNLKFTKGSGSGEPTGFLHDATPYTVAHGSALDLDIALDLAYSVPALYRPNGVYMCSDTTMKYLRKLKTGISGDKRSLWKDAFEEGNASLGTPAKLHGYSLIVNNDMDSVSSDGTFSGVEPLVFGDFKRFVVRQAEKGATRVYRYQVPAKDGGAVIAFQRSDSKLLVNTAISALGALLS